MQRALGRAYARIQGSHPRREASRAGRAAEIFCDILLVLAFASFLGGIALVAAALLVGLGAIALAAGGVLALVGPVLLLLWERLAWDPFVKRMQTLD